ncbi:MAG: hypothetical protein EXR66_01830 [Dehalococcoidia bacterium]|nr:hypothetical protein [Dehalococcoidia bacterium]
MTLATRTPPTPEEFTDYKRRFSNWSRWGAEDEFGTLNFMPPAVRRSAAAMVTEGRSVSCANPLAVTPAPRNQNPAQHCMRFGPTGSSDYIGVSYHDFVNTHIDALCHIWTEPWGQMYNGRLSSDFSTTGSRSNSVDRWRDGIVTRGVLYDVPRFRGTPHVAVDRHVHGGDLADIAKAQGVEPRPGDAVLVRSGTAPFFEANPRSRTPCRRAHPAYMSLPSSSSTTPRRRPSAGICRRRAASPNTPRASASTRRPSPTWACHSSTTRTSSGSPKPVSSSVAGSSRSPSHRWSSSVARARRSTRSRRSERQITPGIRRDRTRAQ